MRRGQAVEQRRERLASIALSDMLEQRNDHPNGRERVVPKARGEGIANEGSRMDDLTFIGEVAGQLGCDQRQAENIIYAVFRELRDRLTAGEAADVAAQLPSALKHFWQEQERGNRQVERTHVADFVARIRAWAALADDDEADRAVRVVFRELQKLLGSSTGIEGEAWDVFSQLPKDLKKLWLACAPRAPRA